MTKANIRPDVKVSGITICLLRLRLIKIDLHYLSYLVKQWLYLEFLRSLGWGHIVNYKLFPVQLSYSHTTDGSIKWREGHKPNTEGHMPYIWGSNFVPPNFGTGPHSIFRIRIPPRVDNGSFATWEEDMTLEEINLESFGPICVEMPHIEIVLTLVINRNCHPWTQGNYKPKHFITAVRRQVVTLYFNSLSTNCRA